MYYPTATPITHFSVQAWGFTEPGVPATPLYFNPLPTLITYNVIRIYGTVGP